MIGSVHAYTLLDVQRGSKKVQPQGTILRIPTSVSKYINGIRKIRYVSSSCISMENFQGGIFVDYCVLYEGRNVKQVTFCITMSEYLPTLADTCSYPKNYTHKLTKICWLHPHQKQHANRAVRMPWPERATSPTVTTITGSNVKKSSLCHVKLEFSARPNRNG